VSHFRLGGGGLAALAVVSLIAFNLRPSLSSVGPVLNEAMRALHLSASAAAMLTTAPVVCLGLFGPVAPLLARRFGIERAILLALATIALGIGVRAGGSLLLLVGGSLLAGAGVAVGNVLSPSLLKRDFPHRLPLATGLYTMAVCVGAAVAAGFTAPLRLLAGQVGLTPDWAFALAAWSVPATFALAVAAVAWRRHFSAGAAGVGVRLHSVRGLWRSPLAWQVTFYMGLQSAMGYIVFAWLPPILRSRGDDAVTAGAATSLCILAQTLAALPVPLLAARQRQQSVAAVAMMLLAGTSFLALVHMPLAWQWLLATTLGTGMGGAFALAIMLIVLRAADGHTAAALSSMAQSVGYTMAAAGPLLVGMLHDATGDWSGAVGIYLGIGSIGALTGALAGRDRLVRPRVRD
jgi:CP family cyanate transporter-like MFS transporter